MPNKEYYWANRDKCLHQSREWHKNNPPNPEKKIENDRKYKARHRKVLNQKQKEYAQENPEKIKAVRFIHLGMRRGKNDYPLAEFCELCPDGDLRKATQHHHFDYDYQEFYVSVCNSCHKFADRATMELI